MINPASKERFVWRHTAASTGGEFAEFELILDEGASVAAAHVHPHQREDFRLEQGVLDLRVARRKERLEPGAERSVPPATAHAWWNAGQEEARVVVRLTPAMRSEDWFETFCGLARDGKANKKGLPRNPLQLFVMAHEYRREFGLPSAPVRAAAAPFVALLAAVGRAAGFRSRYPEYSSD
jgi:mannose-6-phosphate isomerase-like protein (cupin superfamily)